MYCSSIGAASTVSRSPRQPTLSLYSAMRTPTDASDLAAASVSALVPVRGVRIAKSCTMHRAEACRFQRGLARLTLVRGLHLAAQIVDRSLAHGVVLVGLGETGDLLARLGLPGLTFQGEFVDQVGPCGQREKVPGQTSVDQGASLATLPLGRFRD